MERILELFMKDILTLEEFEKIKGLECVTGVKYNGKSGFMQNAYLYIVTINEEEFYVYTDKRA